MKKGPEHAFRTGEPGRAEETAQREAAVAEDHVGLGQKLSYGVGSMGFHLSINSIKQIGNPLFNITLGLNPSLIGLVFIISRLWDAFTDPLMGWISDNTKSRFGRRIPYILAGSITSAIMLALICVLAPLISGERSLFLFFMVGSLLLYTCVTVLQVPFNALGFELSPDYHERTRIMAYRFFFIQVANLIMPWFFWFSQLEVFGSVENGFRVTGLLLGVLIIGTVIPVVLCSKERYRRVASNQVRLSLVKAIGETFQNRAFIVLIGLTFCIIFGSNFDLALGLYVNIYYVAEGDTLFGARLHGLQNTIGSVAVFIAIPFVAKVSAALGKLRTLGILLWMTLIGSLLKLVFFTPSMPYLQLAIAPVLRFGEMGFWLLITSMKADICDCDEWKTGMRREGMFSAVSGWFQKFSQAISFGVASGLILDLIGFQAERAAEQSEATLFWMRICFSVLPAVLTAVALVLLRFYPIDEAYFRRIRSDLESRRGTV